MKIVSEAKTPAEFHAEIVAEVNRRLEFQEASQRRTKDLHKLKVVSAAVFQLRDLSTFLASITFPEPVSLTMSEMMRIADEDAAKRGAEQKAKDDAAAPKTKAKATKPAAAKATKGPEPDSKPVKAKTKAKATTVPPVVETAPTVAVEPMEPVAEQPHLSLVGGSDATEPEIPAILRRKRA